MTKPLHSKKPVNKYSGTYGGYRDEQRHQWYGKYTNKVDEELARYKRDWRYVNAICAVVIVVLVAALFL
jgi:hypothetical protein